MKKLVAVAVAAALAGPGPALADGESAESPFTVAPFVGAYVPTGGMRGEVESAPLVAVTASIDLAPYLAAVGTFGWAPTKVKRLPDGELDLLQYDLGLQAQHAFAVGGGIALQPFAGAGAGLRSYLPRHYSHGAQTSWAWYAGGGASLRLGAATVTLAARYNLSIYDSPTPVLGADDVTRTDLALAASVGVRF